MLKHVNGDGSKAKLLRKNLTKEERLLWFTFLKNYPVKFYRQRAINGYVVDFYCAKAKLVIEIDGDYHYAKGKACHDDLKSLSLERSNLKIYHIHNSSVRNNLKEVCVAIDTLVKNILAESTD